MDFQLQYRDSSVLAVIRYRPQKYTALEIRLFFDEDTFQHVMTEYTVSINPGIARSDVASARQQETRYRIEERFSDFQIVEGLTLPSHYDLRFTQDLQKGSTLAVEWEVTTSRVLNNVPLAPDSFQVK